MKAAALSKGTLDPAAGEGAAVYHFGTNVGERGGAITPGDCEGGIFDNVITRGAINAVRCWGKGKGRDGGAGIGIVGIVLGGGTARVTVCGCRYRDGRGCEDE